MILVWVMRNSKKIVGFFALSGTNKSKMLHFYRSTAYVKQGNMSSNEVIFKSGKIFNPCIKMVVLRI